MTRKVAFSASQKKQQLQQKRAKKQQKDADKWDSSWKEGSTLKGDAKIQLENEHAQEEKLLQFAPKKTETFSMVTDETSKYVVS